jgi:hypothetical protein
MNQHSSERGFVALMSVIIISVILLVFVYFLSAASLLERFDALDGESKRVSLALAEACVNAATLKIAQADYTAAQVVVDSSDPQKTCRICQLNSSGQMVVRAVYNHAYTNLAVTVNVGQASYPITAWAESAVYSGPACTLP